MSAMHPHWLFIGNVLAHWVAAMSSIVSFTLGIVEYLRDRKTEGWIFVAIAGLFLMVAFDQAWQDEHRNGQAWEQQRNDAYKDRDFWKDQNYQKDTALRMRDELLGKNYSVLGQTQLSLANLSNRLLDVAKPSPQRIDVQWTGVGEQSSGNLKTQTILFIARTNKTLPEVRHKLACAFPFTYHTAGLTQKQTLSFMFESGQDSDREASFTIQREWTPEASLVLVTTVAQENISKLDGCTITPKR